MLFGLFEAAVWLEAGSMGNGNKETLAECDASDSFCS
jgi:hypothetical protein